MNAFSIRGICEYLVNVTFGALEIVFITLNVLNITGPLTYFLLKVSLKVLA